MNVYKGEQQCAADAQAVNQEFGGVVKEWMRYSSRIKWEGLYPVLNKKKPWDMIGGLVELDMKPLMDHLQHFNKKNKHRFGNLLLMTNCSKCQLSGLNA